MSNSNSALPTGLEWLGQVGSGYTGENTVENRIQLPYAQVHNDQKNDGKGGGLFIKKATVIEFFGSVNSVKIDEKYFQPVSIAFEDDNEPGKYTNEEGWIAKEYRIVILGTDHNARGYPQAYKVARKGKRDRWFFHICAYIREFYCPDLPFKLTFGGAASGIGMAQIVRYFDQYVVGHVTNLKRKQLKDAPPVSRHEFWLPVTHLPEKVKNKIGEASWACPVLVFKPETWSLDSEMRKTGEPVLKAFQMQPELIGKLFIGSYPNGLDMISHFKEMATIYPKEVCIDIDADNPDATAAASQDKAAMPHFVADGDSKTPGVSEDQIQFVSHMEIKLNKYAPNTYTVDGEIQALRTAGTLKGGDDKSNILMLSTKGGSLLIDHLKALVSTFETKTEPVAGQIPSNGATTVTEPAVVSTKTDFLRSEQAKAAQTEPVSGLPAGMQDW